MNLSSVTIFTGCLSLPYISVIKVLTEIYQICHRASLTSAVKSAQKGHDHQEHDTLVHSHTRCSSFHTVKNVNPVSEGAQHEQQDLPDASDMIRQVTYEALVKFRS